MKFGVLTTRHHDGFALWDSQVSTFDVASTPWQDGQGDVVRAYVDAFRAHDLLPGLYYSVWDSTRPVGGVSTSDKTPVTPEQLDYVKAQLTELLTNYGPIPLLIFDGWGWKMGHRQVPYQEIRALVKSLQPDCLLLDNSHLMSPWENDLAGVEEAQGNTFAPADNTFPAVQMQKINLAGGNDWFWAPNIASVMTVSTIVDAHIKRIEPLWANFLLNCPPNRDGLLPAEIVTRLAEVGAAWSPDTAARRCRRSRRRSTPLRSGRRHRDQRPGQLRDRRPGRLVRVQRVGNRRARCPQSVTVDLGQVRPDVSVLNYVPRYVAQVGPSADGAITSYAVHVSTDGAAFTMVATGDWPANGLMKTAAFAPVAARYVKLEALAVNGTNAAATEIAIGARRR